MLEAMRLYLFENQLLPILLVLIRWACMGSLFEAPRFWRKD
jgi:hypothetical protein